MLLAKVSTKHVSSTLTLTHPRSLAWMYVIHGGLASTRYSNVVKSTGISYAACCAVTATLVLLLLPPAALHCYSAASCVVGLIAGDHRSRTWHCSQARPSWGIETERDEPKMKDQPLRYPGEAHFSTIKIYTAAFRVFIYLTKVANSGVVQEGQAAGHMRPEQFMTVTMPGGPSLFARSPALSFTRYDYCK